MGGFELPVGEVRQAGQTTYSCKFLLSKLKEFYFSSFPSVWIGENSKIAAYYPVILVT
jgi:hypothetical protein